MRTAARLGFQSLLRAAAGNRYDVPVGWGIIGTHIGPRAQRRGVGSALFAASREAALAARLTRIDATIAADNATGLGYYEAMGFRTYRAGGTGAKSAVAGPGRRTGLKPVAIPARLC
jgi:ribosomal protein S18 acetylase RimI-like enzyme